MNRSAKSGYVILGMIALTALMSIFVWAESSYPFGAREIAQQSPAEKANLSMYPPASIYAEAGNVTELNITAISVTDGWQGYYGNITGIITLEDAQGNVFYNWSSSEPKGEIFASVNGSIDWAGIRCFNWSDYAYQGIDVETEEARYNFGDDAADGINETFRQAGLNSDIFVASQNISGNATEYGITCHTANPYQYSVQDTNLDNFENFLLTDGAGALVFSAVIENNEFNNITDLVGFDNAPHDFQMLVAEDGHADQADFPTLYYFWLELG